MFCTLIITRYPKYLGLFGFLSMLFFRLPLWFNKKIKFWKSRGASKTGRFIIHPALGHGAALFTSDEQATLIPTFINAYWKFFRCDVKHFIMQPIAGHGLWDGKQVFYSLSESSTAGEPVAVLTRATIYLNRVKNFWKNVPGITQKINGADGLILSYGIGELPLLKQATFSVWEDESSMKSFAYKTQEHADVIRKTRSENWYKEELFVRFRIISATGFDKKIAAKMCTLPALYEKA